MCFCRLFRAGLLQERRERRCALLSHSNFCCILFEPADRGEDATFAFCLGVDLTSFFGTMYLVQMNPIPKILGIEGSPRKGGNSHHLLRAVLKGAESRGITTHSVHLRDYRYEPCVGCEKCRKDKICTRFLDGMTLLYPEIQSSRGLVLVSPVHNYNVTAWMKAFIDRLYCFYEFQDTRPRQWASNLAGQGRKAVIAAVAEQECKEDMGFTLDAMRRPLEALGYVVVAEIPVLGIFDRGGVTSHPEVLEKAVQSGVRLAHALHGE